MQNQHLSYILALGANFSFASASLVFAAYSRSISALWMNAFKAVWTLVFLIITLPFMVKLMPLPFGFIWPLFASGFLALGIGDLFLFKAFGTIGASRTLILFGFHPLILALSSFFIFQQKLEAYHFISIALFIVCLILFSLENYKVHKNWELKGLLFALIGVVIDALGVILSRFSFDQFTHIPSEYGHLVRTSGAVFSFILIHLFIRKIGLVKNFSPLSNKMKGLLIMSAFAGTYLSLLFYLKAIKIGHLASVSAISITGPIFATTFECIYYKRKPGKYLIASLGVFVISFIILYKGKFNA